MQGQKKWICDRKLYIEANISYSIANTILEVAKCLKEILALHNWEIFVEILTQHSKFMYTKFGVKCAGIMHAYVELPGHSYIAYTIICDAKPR